TGLQVNLFANAITTDRILIRLAAKEMGVDFYSLREIRLRNGLAQVQPRLPSAIVPLTQAPSSQSPLLCAFDGDASTQWTCGSQGQVSALELVGEYLSFLRLKVVGFGCKPRKECFAFFIQAPHGSVLMEDCTFSDPAPENGDTITVVRLVA